MAYTKGLIGKLITKFNTQEFTWKEAGVHYATLNACVKRNLLEGDSSGYKITSKGRKFSKIEMLANSDGFIVLRNKDAKLGMLCSVDKYDIIDCWELPYNYEDSEFYLDRKEWRKL